MIMMGYLRGVVEFACVRYCHKIKFTERRLRHISVGTRNTFFPRAGKPFDVKIGNQIVEMVINECSRMKPRFRIWSSIKLLNEMKIGDTFVFTKLENGIYKMKRVNDDR